MKKVLIFLTMMTMSVAMLLGCKKNNQGAGSDNGDYGNNPRSQVPAELVGGYWHTGSFSMSQFSNYDGSYAGQAYEIAIGYKFVSADGNAEQYFYYTNTSSYCRSQVLGYRKGTVVFDTNNKTFKFYATSGNYRKYDNCGSSQTPGYGVKKNYGSEDLYPLYKAEYNNWEIVKENNKTIWRIRFDDNSTHEFQKTENPK